MADFIKLDSGVVINPEYITAIDEWDDKMSKYKYVIHTIDKHKWYATQRDYDAIMQSEDKS